MFDVNRKVCNSSAARRRTRLLVLAPPLPPTAPRGFGARRKRGQGTKSPPCQLACHEVRTSCAATHARSPQLRPCACEASRSDREAEAEEDANQLIENILSDIRNTDFGARVPKAKRSRIDKNIVKLISMSSTQKPLEDPALFSNYSVAYSSPGPDQKGAPAGGRFRGPLGRFLFRTTGLYQAILKPDLAKNLVTFLLFGIMPGSIALEGTFKKVGKKTVKVIFNRPKFTLLGQTFSFGPASAVELETPALYGNKMRIGKGSRGSLFVFVPDEKSQQKKVMEEWSRVPRKRSWVLIIMLLAMLVAFLYAMQQVLGSKALLLCTVLLLSVGSVVNRGGIVDDPKCPTVDE